MLAMAREAPIAVRLMLIGNIPTGRSERKGYPVLRRLGILTLCIDYIYTISGNHMMIVHVESGSQTALYAQLVEQIQLQILSGKLLPQEELPSLRKLAVDTGTSLITTRRAYEELESEGWIVSLGGRGTRVAALEPAFLSEKRRELVEQRLKPGVDLARSLGMSPSEFGNILKSLQEER